MLGYCAVGFAGLERDDERDDVVDRLESKGHVREKDPPVAVLVLLLRRERRREERREKNEVRGIKNEARVIIFPHNVH